MTDKDRKLHEIVTRVQRIVGRHLQIDKVPLEVDGATLSPAEVHALQAIGGNQGCNMTALGEILGVTKSAASQMVTKLERKKVVRRIPSPDSGKEILLFLTKAGQDIFLEYHAFDMRHMSNLIERLNRFPESALSDASAVLAEIERTADERMEDLFRKQDDRERRKE
ncbi:MarR family transcriptional regulator [Dethiosulfovibrio sp. F2B]|uniref:MarR family winged helix-turn-helix transcriptional regulator n=1 Tax=Dethiosulfovibrio faecalis TaxID=2720018 RepID=UPI001F3EC701|nr:MarR family transcriptional regulator [Dethiosulfovibrio faecalis]MCF4152310.1 MarR family transcriptional regulator [Dethiosulfovibrio faecalis]